MVFSPRESTGNNLLEQVEPGMPWFSDHHIRDEVFSEQIDLVYRLGTFGAIASWFTSSLYAFVVFPSAEPLSVVGWYLAINAMGVARILGARLWRQRGDKPDLLPWVYRCLAFASLSGLFWGYAATGLFPFEHHEIYFISAFILIGMPAGAIGSFGAWFPAFACYLLGAVVPFAIVIGLRLPWYGWLTALMAGVFIGFLAQVGRNTEKTIKSNISQRIALAQLTDRLVEARDAAQAANRAKSSFLANMSHEIRTPLNAVIGISDLLLDSLEEPVHRVYASTIRQSAGSLLEIINDVLDLSRIEAGRLSLREQDFALRPLLGDLLNMFQPSAAQKKLGFGIEVQPEVPDFLHGDPTRLRQILVNLIGNAFKFTEQGRIQVRSQVESLAEGSCLLRFIIEDTGIGIAATDRDLLFQPFSQIETSSARRYHGVGLGLRISAELASRMGGHIGVDSEPGQGSRFWFCVRMGLGMPPSAAAPAVPVSPPSLAGRRVLLVEDNEVNRLIAKVMLESIGCEVVTAGHGREALERMEPGRFDLVLMDCRMPEMDGFEATRLWRVRETALSLPRLPIVAVTANALEGDREQCLQSGMDDYLAKPFVRAQLVGILARWMKPGGSDDPGEPDPDPWP